MTVTNKKIVENWKKKHRRGFINIQGSRFKYNTAYR
jgi:hypothetical protein